MSIIKMVRIKVFTTHHESWLSMSYESYQRSPEFKAELCKKLIQQIDELIADEESKKL